MNNNVKLGIKIIGVITLVILLSLTSYAWFADRSNPTINGSQIQVAAADGLVIKLSPDSIARTSVDLNQVINDYEDFKLRQVSSADGINFYYIDFGEGLSISNPKFVNIPDGQSANYGYVDYDFYLETEDYAKYVYIHKDTFLDGVAKNSVRIAITITGNDENDVTTIFGTTEENGITSDFTTEAVVAEGEFEYGNVSSSLVSNQIVHPFSYMGGGRTSSDTLEIDNTKVLTMIPAATSVKINVKIWLEGGDVDCNNTIASTMLDVLLKFGSANVLLDAPDVYASGNIIANLTTDMEWSYDKDSLEWTKVTDPSMTFATGQTVYVRLSEVVGTSPCSYSKQVNF